MKPKPFNADLASFAAYVREIGFRELEACLARQVNPSPKHEIALIEWGRRMDAREDARTFADPAP